MATSQPNVLFIITDQHRADHVGFMGNDVVRTPNLDALADRGTVFESAWVSNPVCMPNRSSIMTGRVPSAHGVIFNDRSLEWGANTFVRQFRANGYRTGLLGKSHLQHGMSRNAVMPSPGGPSVADPYPAGWDTLEHGERYIDGAPDWPDDFYGFDTVELSIDHGARVSGHHYLWAVERGADPADLLVPQTAENPRRRGSDLWWQIYDPPYDEAFHSTSFVTDRTIDFIERASAQGSPWLAWASFPDPHHPFTPPGQWYDRHRPEDMEVPATIDDPLEGAPEYLKRFQARTVDKMRLWVALTGATSPEVVQAAMAANYGAIEMIDDRVGQILATVDRLGQTDDTIVVFTADHGDMMGDHGLLLKGFMHYRGTLQVPMLIVDPRRKQAPRSSSLASSIDLGPTLMDLCGVAPFHGIQGHSLTPILDDAAARVRDSVLIEEDVDAPAGVATPMPATIRSLITEGHRYTRYSSGEDGAYALGPDGDDECTNLAPLDPELRAELLGHLADAMMAHTEKSRLAPVAQPSAV
ncbi:MAG: sulfatase-like hydrolase/transferase [Actinomycetota bacterium]